MQREPEAASPEAEGKPASLRRIRNAVVVMTCVVVLGGAAFVVVNGAENASQMALPLLSVFSLPFVISYLFVFWRLRGGPDKKGLRLAMDTGTMGLGLITALALFITAQILIQEGTETVRDVMILLAVILFSGTLAGLHWILRGNAKRAYEAAWPEEGRQRPSKWSRRVAWVFVVLALLLLGVASPSWRNRTGANEAAAVGSLRSINAGCVTYSSTYGGFPPTLATLGPPGADAAPTAAAADLIDSVLAAGSKSGYTFTYTAGAAVAGSIPTYTIKADPVTPGRTGRRFFFTDQSGVVRADPAAKATVASKPL